MSIEITKEWLLKFAADARPDVMPTYAEEMGIAKSNMTIGGKDYLVTYMKNVQTGNWFLSDMTNADGTPIS